MSKLKISDYIDQIGDGMHGTPDYIKNGEYYFINGNNLSNGKIVLSSDTPMISQEEYNKIKRPLNERTILLSINGTLGRIAIYQGENVALGKSACYINVKSDKNKYFVKYVLSTKEFQKYILLVAHGSTIKNLAPSQVAAYEFNVPDGLKEDKVAFLLKAIDDKIEVNNKINAELESMAKTIYDYWFLQYEFPNENGKPYKSSGGKMVWNEELKREIPEEWECVQLGELFSFIKGKIPERLSDTQEERLYPYITIDVANDAKTQYCSDENMIYCNGEVIMVMDGAASGDVYIGNRGILGSTFAMMKTKRKDISDALIYSILKRQSVIYKKANTGSTVPHANRRFIENIKVPISKNMKDCTRILDEIYEKIIQNRRENQELISLRDFLLPLLMNGQIGFKD